jgi:hypothetical protein
VRQWPNASHGPHSHRTKSIMKTPEGTSDMLGTHWSNATPHSNSHSVVKDSLSFWDPHVYVCIQFVITFTNQNIFYFYFFCRRIPTSQLRILQNLKQFKLINLYLQGFEDWSCGHWHTYLSFLGGIESVFVGMFLAYFLKMWYVGHGFEEISMTSRMRVEKFHIY